jgi:uncharacterized protein YvpB
MRTRSVLKTVPLLLIILGVISWGFSSFKLNPGSSTPTPPPAPPNDPALITLPAPAASLTPLPAFAGTSAPVQATLAPSLTPIRTLPVAHVIGAIRGHHQYFPLGCEAAAAKDWANYFGKDFNEFEFQYKLPVSDNPDFGFVGNVNSPWGQVPPYGYGVHAGPVADLLNKYGIQARAAKGYTLDQIKANIAQDKPVIVWVIGNVVGGVPYVYTDSQGNKVTVAAYEHVVIVTGYDESHIRYMNNGKFYVTPTSVFLNSWGVLGNMVIVEN